ncbi:hypothetical protein HK097_000377 [Rhizophlyctis rosea]|uniref:Prolyl 4-hydroxylase alpha subunit domain-containing protein n=1 Tax=Rhizophlyctis rosea TaxID=64517 RepID=A0AAD5SJS0_9FUNG|nr:hypothetical protein HK097_000377 [Rhizophlyctis rosea]
MTPLHPVPPPIPTLINFATSPLPEYSSHYALVIDNLFTPEECACLLADAEREGGDWEEAQVNVGGGKQMTMSDYRNSERIMWDSEEKAGWIMERVRPYLGLGCGTGSPCFVNGGKGGGGGVVADGGHDGTSGGENGGEGKGGIEEWISESAKKGKTEWVVTRLNERLRFLRYGPGQYFKKHCDGAYTTPNNTQTSFITLHMYLTGPTPESPPTFPSHNSLANPTFFQKVSNAILQTSSPLSSTTSTTNAIRGGATRFWGVGLNHRSWMDVEPRVGRVLLFQHRGLVHSGEEVRGGVKVSVRTDLMYRKKEGV